MSELVAYHEAGHALVAALRGGRVRQVTIEPDDDDGPARDGDTQVLWRMAADDDRRFAAIAVEVCLAGPVAEMLYLGEAYHPGHVAEWAADWRDAWEAAAPLHAAELGRMRYLEAAARRLYRMLKEEPCWSALAALADSLLAHETLDAEQVTEVLADWLD